MNCDRVRELVSEALDGTLTGSTAERFHTHVDTCPPCGAFFAEMRESLTLLEELPLVEVGDDFDRTVWGRIRAEKSRDSRWESWKRRCIDLWEDTFPVLGKWSPIGVAAAVLTVFAFSSEPTPPGAGLKSSEGPERVSTAREIAVNQVQERTPLESTVVEAENDASSSELPEAVEAFLRSGRELVIKRDDYRRANYSYPLRRVTLPNAVQVGIEGRPVSGPVRPATQTGSAVIAFYSFLMQPRAPHCVVPWIGGLAALLCAVGVRASEPRELLEGDILHIAERWKNRVFLVVADGGPARVPVEEVLQNPTKLYRKRRVGCAVYIGDERLLLTTAAVVRGNDEVEVFNDEGEHVLARIIGLDPHLDLALLQAVDELPNTHGTPPLEASEEAPPGTPCMVLGSAYGRALSASLGTLGEMIEIVQSTLPILVREVNAPIYPGDSGGPVLDAEGRFLGIVTATQKVDGEEERDAFVGEMEIRKLRGRPQGASGFAVPGADCERAWVDMREYGHIRRGYLGVGVLGFEGEAGAHVVEVKPQSPAAAAGLRAGDVITTFGSHFVASPRHLCALVSRMQPHRLIDLRLIRDRQEYIITVEIDEAKRLPGIEKLDPAARPPDATMWTTPVVGP